MSPDKNGGKPDAIEEGPLRSPVMAGRRINPSSFASPVYEIDTPSVPFWGRFPRGDDRGILELGWDARVMR